MLLFVVCCVLCVVRHSPGVACVCGCCVLLVGLWLLFDDTGRFFFVCCVLFLGVAVVVCFCLSWVCCLSLVILCVLLWSGLCSVLFVVCLC